MDKNQFFKKDALRPTREQRLLTQEFYWNANVVYRHFDDWKDVDRFYFIPLYLEMTYCINGIVAELAPDPVWLGSFVRCTLEHRDYGKILPFFHLSYRTADPCRCQGAADEGLGGTLPVGSVPLRSTPSLPCAGASRQLWVPPSNAAEGGHTTGRVSPQSFVGALVLFIFHDNSCIFYHCHTGKVHHLVHETGPFGARVDDLVRALC